MGYRSDVGLGIVFENDEKLKEFALKVVAFQPDTVREALLEYSRSTGGDGFIFAGFEDVKWYDSFPDVQGHHMLQELARENGAGTAFVRVGEETSDTVLDILEPNDSAEMDRDALQDRMQILYDNFDLIVHAEFPRGGKPLQFDQPTTTQEPQA
jgi:hypothetical protein